VSAQKARPFSIHIFLPDGVPDGLRIVQKSNWTGVGVVCPRPVIVDAKQRSEFGRAGVYILVGPPEEGSLPLVYIGQGDPIRPRLEQHDAKKDFWNSVVFFVSKDENLNKAHIEYLEARLIQIAKTVKRCKLDNGNDPKLPSLSEMDCADCDSFLDEMLLCFPILGLSIFEAPPKPQPAVALLHLKGPDAEGTGYETAQGFVVLAGARARINEVPSIHKYISDQRKTLAGLGLLAPDGATYRLTQDRTFESPSTAAAVLLGRSANGRIEWKDKEGRTLKEIQSAKAGSEGK
jgi:hypothetical protein